jgi:hypothetical protein
MGSLAEPGGGEPILLAASKSFAMLHLNKLCWFQIATTSL